MTRRFKPLWGALVVWLAASAVYLSILGSNAWRPSPDRHFVHLANGFLHGQFAVVDNAPKGQNDWACFDTVEKDGCPPGRFSFTDKERYRWYISFPPFPAVLLLPFVAIGGTEIWDRAVWGGLAGAGPAALFLLLEAFRTRRRSDRSLWENLLFTVLFAFGSVYFFVAVQGTVWFAAHVVAVPLIALYLLCALDAKRPLLAGTCLALAFMTRPTTLLLAPFLFLEACRVSRDSPFERQEDNEAPWLRVALEWFRGVRWRQVAQCLVWFATPLFVVGVVAMIMNYARFEDPFEFGHRFLQIRWRERIERWGLFNYHYFPKNLAVFLAAMPWLSALPPYLMIGRHGLALWFTTPHLLALFFPRKPLGATGIALALSALAVAILNLCYQNSGWFQFGYRFSLDYMPVLIVLLALGGRRIGPIWWSGLVFAVLVNGFGAFTFDRVGMFYDTDPTQNVIFQPD